MVTYGCCNDTRSMRAIYIIGQNIINKSIQVITEARRSSDFRKEIYDIMFSLKNVIIIMSIYF